MKLFWLQLQQPLKRQLALQLSQPLFLLQLFQQLFLLQQYSKQQQSRPSPQHPPLPLLQNHLLALTISSENIRIPMTAKHFTNAQPVKHI